MRVAQPTIWSTRSGAKTRSATSSDVPTRPPRFPSVLRVMSMRDVARGNDRRYTSGLSNDLAVWRNLWDDGDDLARHARAFIAGQLAASAHR
jgi:hypothetical protein